VCKEDAANTAPLFRVQEGEAHRVRRWCGHEEILWLGPPWAYVETVASQVTCAACRKLGRRGPLDREDTPDNPASSTDRP